MRPSPDFSVQVEKRMDPNSGIVIFDSRYGYTEKIAMALAKGLKKTGFQVDCINAATVVTESL